jgi:small nuclear ribonucleoprotein (snRNP)-like protein
MLNRDDRNSETVTGSASSEVRARRESGHLIGLEVVVKLVNGEVVRGTSLDDYLHAIAIRRSEDDKIVNIGWDKILYIEKC